MVWLSIFVSAAMTRVFAAEQSEKPATPAELASLSIEELEKVHVTTTTIATGRQEPVAEAPAIATVITAEEIKAKGATNFVEALEGVPGLHAATSGENYIARYLIRGISTSFTPETLVMINGIPIVSTVRGDQNANLGILPLTMVSKIELIRGPGSALYGADAFAGVINVITKEPKEVNGTEIGGRLGTFDSQEVWLFHSEISGDLKVLVMADYFNTDGQSRTITVDAQTALDTAFGTRASLAPGPVSVGQKRFGLFADIENKLWRLRGSYYGANVGPGQGSTQALVNNTTLNRSRTMIDLTFHDPKIARDLDFSATFSYQHDIQEHDKGSVLFPPGANLGKGVFPNGVIGIPDYWERIPRIDSTLLYSGFKNHHVRAGLGYFYGDLYKIEESKNFTPDFTPLTSVIDVSNTPEAYLPETSRYDIYGFIQDEWKFAANWQFTVGVRYDHYSDFGGTANPRAALVWKTTPELTTKLLYGRAFRAPYFAERYTVNNPVLLGNPDLNPETINVYEIAWMYQPSLKWHLGLNLFHYNADDLINSVRNAQGAGVYQNEGSQTGNGYEVETKIQPVSELVLTGTYSFVYTEFHPSGGPAGNYPRHMAYLRDDWGFLPSWSWSNQIFWVGGQDRAPNDSRAPLKSYTTVDTILRRKAFAGKLEIAASVRNIFDADAREPSAGPGATARAAAIPNDLPQAGRSAYGELTYRF